MRWILYVQHDKKIFTLSPHLLANKRLNFAKMKNKGSTLATRVGSNYRSCNNLSNPTNVPIAWFTSTRGVYQVWIDKVSLTI